MAKKIVLTGGGTLGHVTPHLALIPHLRERGYEIHYIGTENGMEAGRMRAEPGVIYHAVKGGKLRRYHSWQNFTDPFRVIAGAFQSARLMGQIRPDVVFSKGGFVAVPVVFGAWLHRVPVLCHESDLTPGLANRLCRPFAKRFATTFPECAEKLGKKAEMTGTPLRPELFRGSREKGLDLFGFSGEKPVLLMMGGSSGAQAVNEALRAGLDRIAAHFDVAHICGKGNLMPELEGRAGANALCEFQHLGRPMLLVPYPMKASRGDQILNARSLQKRGLCHVLMQEDLTPESLADALEETWADRERLEKALRDAPPADGTERVLEMIEEIQKR